MKQALIGLLFLSSQANASNWLQSSTATDGSIWYVDLDSVKPVSDGYGVNATKSWIKIDYSKVKTKIERENRILFFFKCNEEQAKTISQTRYKSDGTVLDSYTPPYATYQPVVPDSVLSSAMEIVCATVALQAK